MEKIKISGGKLFHGESRGLKVTMPQGVSGFELKRWKKKHETEISKRISEGYFPFYIDYDINKDVI